MTEVMSATTGSVRSIASAWRMTSVVRATDGAAGQLHDDEERALIVLRQEAGRRDLGQPHDADGGDGDHPEPDDRKAHESRDHGAVAVAHPVDRPHHHADDAAPRSVMRFQQHAAQRRRQRQRVDRRQQHRNRDRDGELAEQFAGDTRNERDRHEHRQQHQRDGDDRRGDLAPSPAWSPPRATARDAPPSPARRSRPPRWRRRRRCRSPARPPAARRCWRNSRPPSAR